MKKIFLILYLVLINLHVAYGSEFYSSYVSTQNETIKMDFDVVLGYLKSNNIKKAVELYNKIADAKKEENPKIISELAFNVLGKIVLDENQHRDLRNEAAFILAQYYGERSIEVLSKAIEDKNYLVQMGVIKALGEIKSDKSFKLVSPFVNDDQDNLKIAAIEALGSIGGSKSEKVLKKPLKSKDYFIRLSSALALFNMGKKDGMDLIKKDGIHESIDKWRTKVVKALANKKDASVIDLLKEALKDKNKQIRNIALNGLMRNESKSINYFFKDLLKMKDKYVVVKAAEYLMKRNNNDEIPILTNYLNDANEFIKVEAAAALIKINNIKAVEIFANCINSKNENVRHLTADYLALLSPSSSLIKIVLKAYLSDDYYVRAKAVEALGKMKSRLYYYEIKKAMYDSHSYVRMTASAELALQGEEDGINSIMDFLNWGNDELRMFSLEIISKTDPEKYLPVIRRIAFIDKSWSVGMRALEITVSIVNK